MIGKTKGVAVSQGGQLENTDLNALRVIGGNRLRGTLKVNGSKNAALAITAAAIMVEGEVLLTNFPFISDTLLMVELLNYLGIKTELKQNQLWIDATEIKRTDTPENIVRKMRASFCVLGSLLVRQGKSSVSMPGGCEIGNRPVDFHLKGLRAMGASVDESHGFYQAEATKLTGTEIYLDYPSPGATQHLMATACLAQGITVIHNAAMEPEVVDLACFLNRMGARIEGAGSSTISIQGVKKLPGGEYNMISDRIEAGTYMIAGALTKGDITVQGVCPDHLQPLTSKLRECGVEVHEGYNWIRVFTQNRYKSTDIKTMPFPGFPTDLQQPMCSLLATADGQSIVKETIYENRNKHVNELSRMGAQIKTTDSKTFIINGVKKLNGATVEAHDLRGGAAMILAALGAQGESLVTGMKYVDRGYQNVVDNLNSLGAEVERISTQSEAEGIVTSSS